MVHHSIERASSFRYSIDPMRRWFSSIVAFIYHLAVLGFLPVAWRMPTFCLLGVAAGLGLVLFRVSEVHSYLSDSPRACINCHIMTPEYITWERSSHGRVAVCNDCHVPHDSLARKYAFKAKDGLRHATIFTLRAEPQVIHASTAAEGVIQENCLRCHDQQLIHVSQLHAGARKCVDCHRETPHGRVHSLASTPNTPFPRLPRLTWIPAPEGAPE